MGERVSAAIDPMIAERVGEYLSEAAHGPELGGISGDLIVGGVVVEAAASRDWGVLFSRSLPSGGVVQEKLDVSDLTLSSAGAAIGRLVRAV